MAIIESRITTVGHWCHDVIGIYELALFGDNILLGNPIL